ncbi:MAG TPA: hypothetical protein VIN93_13090 [Bryobacteraceae bacterium]|jgi:hypothetical protein
MEPHVQKLAQLRARTDRQLVELISAKLDHGFSYARVLAARDAQAPWAAAREFHQRAEDAWREAHHLLPALDGVAETDRAVLLRRVQILREVLDQFAAETLPIKRAACF